MIIERTPNEVIVRLSPSINIEELQRVLNYLEYKEATVDSEATQEEVDALVAEVKKVRRASSRRVE